MKVNYRIGLDKPNAPGRKEHEDYTQPGQMPEIYPPIETEENEPVQQPDEKEEE